MSLDNVSPGVNVPDSFNVIIEIPMNADPVKYEVDKASGAIFVDRFMSTSMHYPTNYGYVPKTISGDGDPVDVLVITPVPLILGVVVTCRLIGILKMQDEAGDDGKVLAVPIDKILSIYSQWQKPEDLNPLRLKTIAHFFEHYKDLEVGKWVKILGWEGADSARKEIMDGIANYERSLAPDTVRVARLGTVATAQRFGSVMTIPRPAFALKPFPLAFRLGEPLGQCPPGLAATQADMAGQHLDVLGMRVDVALRLLARLPRHDPVGAREDGAGWHAWSRRKVVLRGFAGYHGRWRMRTDAMRWCWYGRLRERCAQRDDAAHPVGQHLGQPRA